MPEDFLIGPSNAEHRHYRAEQRYWKRQIRIALWLNWITVAGACVAIFALIGLVVSIRHADQGNIDANRGWIAPYALIPTGKSESGNMTFEIQFANVGKSPAIGMNWKTGGGIRKIPPHFDLGQIKFDRNGMCDGLNPIDEGPFTFPSSPGQEPYRRGVDGGKDIPFDEAIGADRVVYVRGCVTYKTMDVIGKTAFCWILEPIVPDKTNFAKGNSAFCESGSFAK